MADGNVARYIQVGLGAIGCGIVRVARERGGLQLVGAVDVAADKVGRDVAEIAELPEATGVVVCASAWDCPEADMALHSTGSRLSQIADQLREIIELGLDCISTAEELTWPWLSSPALAEELDALAQERGVRLLGTGINPGFVMDLLPLVLTAPCREVERIVARRIVDTATRRPQLQRKTGVGLTESEYRERAEKGAIGHVGLRESAALLAAGLGWVPEAVAETIEPAVAEEAIETGHFTIGPGQVCGSRQTATVLVAGRERVRLELAMYAGAPDPRDEVELTGAPSFTVRIAGGIPGDEATPACVLNAIPPLLASMPGLLTLKDVPVSRRWH
ncbi:MAG: dihydrodipicolinate reductase [Armatimonadetes bacterium]|nr:dihydrodipicolinate reductase [Armatimonadota bacterium]